MMSKIALVTFHSPYNHGARLQAFALQTAMENLGETCRVVDYLPAAKSPPTPSFSVREAFRQMGQKGISVRFARRIRQGEEKMARFSQNYLHLTASIRSEADLETVVNRFDAFVCGSDQIWRDPNIGFYYLDFVPQNKRKIAYAPSFGQVRYSEEERKIIRNRVERLDVLSAREKDGADFLTELTGRSVPTVLDPTLLLDREFWRSVALPPKRPVPKRFILLFTVQNTIPCFRIAEEVRRRFRLPLVAVDMARRLVWRPFLNDYFEAGPEEFLWLVDHSDFVVTTSFHGTVFALNFDKPFLTVCQKGDRNVNARLISLAEKLGVQNRLLFSGQPIPPGLAELNPDQSASCRTRKNLAWERDKSLEFIKKALRGESFADPNRENAPSFK